MTSQNQPDELEDHFVRAGDYVNSHHDSMTFESLLPMYGYFKQATVGPCNVPKPSVFNLRAKMMWKSWSNLEHMSKREAMRNYILHLNNTVSDWDSSASQSKNRSWISVSAPCREEKISDSTKDAFDWVRDGNLEKLKLLAKKVSPNARDDTGLALLHWAADRGHLDIVKYLISEMKADVNCLDLENQTPLHYAAACGHFDVCKYLVDSQASLIAKDGDGLTPVDVAEENSIKELLSNLRIS